MALRRWTSDIPWADTKICPLCRSKLITRERRKDGRKFIGCSAFPTCRFSQEYTHKSEDKTLYTDWRINERIKAKQLKRAGDVHCPRCDLGLLKIVEVKGTHFVRCTRNGCDYKEDYANEEV